MLESASDHYRGRAHFLGVIYQDDPAVISRFLDERGAWGPSLVDPENRVAIAYGVFGPPETFFIDGEGIIADKVIGGLHPQVLREALAALL